MPRSSDHPHNVAANAATRGRLLAAACDEFVEAGYFETDTNKIARRAGLSPATFYKHFRSKAAVFAAAYEHLATDEVERLGEACLARFLAGATLEEVGQEVARVLVQSRPRLAMPRLHASALQGTQPNVLEAKLAVRRHAVAVFERYAGVLGVQTCASEELHVHLHVIDCLVDAIARQEFDRHGVTSQSAYDELRQQWRACFAPTQRTDARLEIRS